MAAPRFERLNPRDSVNRAVMLRAPLSRLRTDPAGLRSVSVYYGTNRARLGECDLVMTAAWNGTCRPDHFYGPRPASLTPGRQNELEVGTFTVTIPPGHETGTIERPRSFFSIDLEAEDPARHVVISELSSFGSEYDAWARAVKSTGKKQAFVYVHGYATSFALAARRAGQLAFDSISTTTSAAFLSCTAGRRAEPRRVTCPTTTPRSTRPRRSISFSAC
jgi:hypothetical protein